MFDENEQDDIGGDDQDQVHDADSSEEVTGDSAGDASDAFDADAGELSMGEDAEGDDLQTESVPVAVAPSLPANVAKSAEAAKAAEELVPPGELSQRQSSLPWYAVHTYAGFELRAKLNLEERIRSRGMQENFGRVLVPQETVVEMVKGVKKTSTRKFFPGYMLVQLDLSDDAWHLVNETPKISGFVGDSRTPMPLSPQEVAHLTQQMEGGPQRPRMKISFEEGDSVKVIDGPFVDFNATVDEVKPDKGKLRVLISIFGRNTPVELDFTQVEKV